MFYGENIQDTRPLFFTSWQKYRQKQPLEPLEQQLVAVILDHPEYHSIFESGMTEQSYFTELGQTNPFLHLGLHLTIRDQISMDRPAGILQVYKKLLVKHSDQLIVEHLMMEYLLDCLWQSQRTNTPPDEKSYLVSLRALIKQL